MAKGVIVMFFLRRLFFHRSLGLRRRVMRRRIRRGL